MKRAVLDPPGGDAVQGDVPKMQRMESERRRVAIYGGSFNPITNAHLNAASECIHSSLVDEVWITPCGPRPDKPSLKTSTLERLVMCHLAVDTTYGSRFGIKVCDEETRYAQALPAYILMKVLAAKHPLIDFYFLFGTDIFPTIKQWNYDPAVDSWGVGPELMQAGPSAGQRFWDEGRFIAIGRPGSEADEMPPNLAHVGSTLETHGKHMVQTDLSSTEVRNRVSRPPDDVVRFQVRRVRHAKSWYDAAEGLVPPSVLGHMVRYGLYAVEESD